MKMQWVKESLEGMTTDVLVIGMYEGDHSLNSHVQQLDVKLSGQISEMMAEGILKVKRDKRNPFFLGDRSLPKGLFCWDWGKKRN